MGITSGSAPYSQPLNDFTGNFMDIGKITGAKEIPESDPDEVLKDLSLPKRIVEILAPAFNEIGYNCEKGLIKERFGEEKVITKIRNSKFHCCLLHIPGWILDNPTKENNTAMTILIDTICISFTKNDRIFLISQGLDSASRVYRKVFTTDLENMGINIKFIPWRDIMEMLQEVKKNHDNFLSLVKEVFQIDMTYLSPKDLDDSAKRQIIHILTTEANNSFLSVAKYFKGLIRDTNFPLEWKNSINDFGDNAQYNASSMVNWSIDKGRIPDHDQYALIHILERIKPSTGVEDSKFLDEIIRIYGLIIE